jgi:hypothetical protein
MTGLKQRQEDFLYSVLDKTFGVDRHNGSSDTHNDAFWFEDGFDAFRESPLFVAMKNAMENAWKKQATTIFIEEPEHVEGFFKEIGEVLKAIEET